MNPLTLVATCVAGWMNRHMQVVIEYLEHPLLGRRLTECAEALLSVTDRSAEDIMGYPDYLKLQSSMTLFAEITAPDSPFALVLQRYYGGTKDPKTLAFLHQ